MDMRSFLKVCVLKGFDARTRPAAAYWDTYLQESVPVHIFVRVLQSLCTQVSPMAQYTKQSSHIVVIGIFDNWILV